MTDEGLASFVSLKYTCSACYLTNMAGLGGLSAIPAALVGTTRLALPMAVMRHGTRMPVYEYMRRDHAGLPLSAFVGGVAAEVAARAVAVPMACLLTEVAKESPVSASAVLRRHARLAWGSGWCFFIFDAVLRPEERSGWWSAVNALAAGCVGGVAGAVASFPSAALANWRFAASRGLVFGIGLALFEYGKVYVKLPTTAMRKRINYAM